MLHPPTMTPATIRVNCRRRSSMAGITCHFLLAAAAASAPTVVALQAGFGLPPAHGGCVRADDSSIGSGGGLPTRACGGNHYGRGDGVSGVRRTLVVGLLSLPLAAAAAAIVSPGDAAAADNTPAVPPLSIAPPPQIVEPRYMATVVLDSPEVKASLVLGDTTVGGDKRRVVFVKSALDLAKGGAGEAEKQGARTGMVLLNYQSAAAVRERIANGPYPIALQFYSLGDERSTPVEGLVAAEEQSRLADLARTIDVDVNGRRGAGMTITTVKKGEAPCAAKSKKGDVVEVRYEARIGGRLGLVYDTSEGEGPDPRRSGGRGLFRLGDGEVVQGVDLGIKGMCVGEVRELDIPSVLGYGLNGYAPYLIPLGSRLFWTVQLVAIRDDLRERRLDRLDLKAEMK